MTIETNIRFVEGGVTITQTIDRGENKESTGTAEDKASGETGSAETGETREAAAQDTPKVQAPFVPGAPKALEPDTTKNAYGGDPGRTDTGGGSPLSGGLVIVFGSLFIDGNSVSSTNPLNRKPLQVNDDAGNQTNREPIDLQPRNRQ